MKRVEIDYLNKTYTLAHTTAEEVRRRVEDALTSGDPFWLRANFGEGKPQPVDLLITPGVGIAISDINVDEGGDVTATSENFTGPQHTSAHPDGTGSAGDSSESSDSSDSDGSDQTGTPEH